MTIREVVRFPNPLLATRCEEIGTVGLPLPEEHARVARDLLDTMAGHPGCVGIAAPQIGSLVRMVAIDVGDHRRAVSRNGRHVLVDPVVEEVRGSIVIREGCLSIPDFTADIRRAQEVVVGALDPDGQPVRLCCDAFEARVLLHELDHLDGLLFLDRVASYREVYPRRRYR